MTPQWHNKLEVPALHDEEIHLWKTSLILDAERQEKLFNLLSAEEKTRAERFKFPIHRQRFIASQGTLRILLGQYLALEPAHISFNLGSHGKPYLAGKNIFFNLSNSQDTALYAITLNNEVGVDIEYHRARVSSKELAERFFSETEKKYFSQVSELQQKEVFFRFWTAKEAFIKAVGEGLSFPLDAFSVDVTEDKERLLEIKGNSQEAAEWYLRIFTFLEDNYTVAVACPHQIKKCLFFNL